MKEQSKGGIGFVGILQICFIVLRLCGVIDWSWWAVMSPLIGSLAMSVLVVTLIWIFGRR